MANLPRLAAERQLDAIEAASMPHMKDEHRKPILARLRRRLRGEKRFKSAGEALATLPIPVVYEPVEEVSTDGSGG